MITTESEPVHEDTVREGQVIMPFYLLADVSSSMRDDEDELNRAIGDLVQSIVKDPVVDDLVMLSVIAFNHVAKTVVELDSPSNITLPTLRAGGGTRYDSAFREYNRAFSADRANLRQQGIKVYRPCVFFLTDGDPADIDSYLQTFRSLFAYDPETHTGNRAFPYFVPFGFREAAARVIQSLAYPDFGATKGRWFLSRSKSAAEILTTVSEVLGRTVISAGESASRGAPMLVPPAPPQGSTIQFGDAGDFVD